MWSPRMDDAEKVARLRSAVEMLDDAFARLEMIGVNLSGRREPGFRHGAPSMVLMILHGAARTAPTACEALHQV